MKHALPFTLPLFMMLALPALAQQANAPLPPELRLQEWNTAKGTAQGITQRNDPQQRLRARSISQRNGITPLPQPPALPRLQAPPALPQLRTASIDTASPPSRGNSMRARAANKDGLRLGAFMLRGESEVGGIFTTRKDANGKDAFGLRSAPDLQLASNWPRHELRFTAQGEFIAWDDGSGEAKGNLSAALRLDARRNTRLRLTLADALDKVQDAATTGVQHDLDATAALEHERYRLSWTLAGGVLRHLEPNNAQEYWQPHVSLRGRLRTSPALAFYGEMGADVRRFDENGAARDSTGGYVEAGAELLRGPIWEGRIGLRGELRDYRDKTRENLKGIGVSGNLTWRPTRQTDIGLEAAFDLKDESSGPTRQQTAALSWRQQLRRTLELRSRLEGEYNAVQSGQDAITLRASASLAWQIWRKLWIVANYGFERNYTESLGQPSGKAEHRLGLGLRQKF